jgi:hypothetical protein
MFLDTREQEYAWFWDGDLNGFQDIRALPVSGGMGPPHMVMTYIPFNFPNTRIKDYGLEVGSQQFLRYLRVLTV